MPGMKLLKCFALLTFTICCSVLATAQSDERKFEVGGQYSFMSLATAKSGSPVVDTDRFNESGFGGRFGYNINRNVTVEAEANFFPSNTQFEGGRKTEVVGGVKIGGRSDKFGAFVKARPGFLHLTAGDYQPIPGTACIAVFPSPIGCFESKGKTNFAFDLGGVVEYYPTTNTILRFDVGDTIVRYGERNINGIIAGPPGPTRLVVVRNPAETVHNFQTSVGFGFRF
jgi:hypothetical protein